MLKFHFIEIAYALHHLAAVGETLVNDRECLLKEEGSEEMAPPPSLSFFLTTPQSLSIILLQGRRGVWLVSTDRGGRGDSTHLLINPVGGLTKPAQNGDRSSCGTCVRLKHR